MHKPLLAILILLLAGVAIATPDSYTLHQVNSTHWYFETQQNDLAEGDYHYRAFANNISSDYRVLEYVVLTYSTHLSAVTAGIAGNAITTTETCADASFGAATLTGGGEGSDSRWAASDVPTGVGVWSDNAALISLVVLVLIIGLVFVGLRGDVDMTTVIGASVGLIVLAAVFGIAPVVGDRIDSVSNLNQPISASGRLTFDEGGTITDGETVVIDATTLEFDRAADGVTAGRVPVNVTDSTDATASLNLTNAINGNATLAAVVTARRDAT